MGLGQNIYKNPLKLVVFLNTTKKSSKYNKNILRYITAAFSAQSKDKDGFFTKIVND